MNLHGASDDGDEEAGPRRKRLALVVPAFADPGGVPAVADFILRILARRPDLDVRIISLSTSARDLSSLLLLKPQTWRRGVVSGVARARGHDFVHVGARFGEIETRRLARRAALDALLQDCDLIQVVAGAPAWATPVLGLGKPVVMQVATLTEVERRERARVERGPLALWRAAMTRAVSRLDHAALRQADVVMVANPWMLDYAGREAKRVVFAPPGLDAAIFHPADPGERRSGRPYILAVGRFCDPRKNPLLLLRAYAILIRDRERYPDLVLAGADPPGKEFWSCADALGLRRSIRFVSNPSVDALAALYRRALCLAVPSDEEGFGVVVIEAMASGIPVVSTRCGGPDGVITDGVEGYLVDRGDAEGMADRLGQLIDRPELAEEMGRRALAAVQARYSDDAAGEAFLKVYDTFLA